MLSFFKNLVKFYRLFLSPLFGGQCRFYPTCSDYALQALDRQPVGEALAKILKRLFRCHPFHPGGCDPAQGKADA